MIKIGTVICFTCNDENFLEQMIKTVIPISDKIVLVYSDRYLNGEMQDISKLNKLIALYKSLSNKIKVVKYDIDPNLEKECEYAINNITWKRYWICLARKMGFIELGNTYDWILQLDSDEFVDINLFNEWKKNVLVNCSQEIKIINFDNYVYYWSPTYQADKYENSITMVRPQIFENNNIVYNEWERTAYHKFFPDRIKLMNVKYNNKSMFHHYSWVRTEKQINEKIKSWGHSDDHILIEIVDPIENKVIKLNKLKIHYMYSDLYGTDWIEENRYNNEYYNELIKDRNIIINWIKYYEKQKQQGYVKNLPPHNNHKIVEELSKFLHSRNIKDLENMEICNAKIKIVDNIFNININI